MLYMLSVAIAQRLRDNEQVKPMSTLNQVLEDASRLPYEQQEMLIEILKRRFIESRRAEIAADAKQTLADFQAGHFQAQSAEEVVTQLRQSLNQPEE